MRTDIWDSLKLAIKANYSLFKLSRLPLAWIGYFEKKAGGEVDQFWQDRITMVQNAPDNQYIKRVGDAGKVTGDVQVMHNGVRIHVGSYYGDGNTVLLERNQGVHEPEEERCFEYVLGLMPANAVMLELGAFWAFYSMSFQKKVKNGKNFLIEPDKHAILSGKNNFKLNKLKGDFFNFFISDKNESNSVPSISVDSFIKEQKIAHLNILHSDIQGYELKMLEGAQESLKGRVIDYLFVSTHSNELHASCKEFLSKNNYLILCDSNLDESYSWDGLIVGRRVEMEGPDSLPIHKRKC